VRRHFPRDDVASQPGDFSADAGPFTGQHRNVLFGDVLLGVGLAGWANASDSFDRKSKVRCRYVHVILHVELVVGPCCDELLREPIVPG
jgi:hypothetical protein